MKWAAETIGLCVVILFFLALIKGPEWIGAEAGKMTVAYRTAAASCQ